ncbi:uncharacterized protein LOC102801984 [Saccoglossus kowalevskii]|uniref:Uncharacterized protein LOC102801984 n=1 Tax=Saccoglossus kowalevskii TaxID=10224 RepID=A0ABM0MIE9_SACKO|nr:PREDICTED: uncharacterized protein LOC102801984 [Saccoglossus kowalevskii]
MSIKSVIEASHARCAEMYNAGDIQALVTEMYHEDCKFMTSGSGTKFGQKGVLEGLESMKKTSLAKVKVTSEEIDGIETDTAYDRGSYIIYKDDGSEVDVGKYLVIWKKVNGKYRAYLDILNSNN